MIKILDLHGNIFEAQEDYNLVTQIPKDLPGSLYLQRDIKTQKSFIEAILSDGKYYYFNYNQSLDLYVQREMVKVGYDESKDIRKSYKYARKH